MPVKPDFIIHTGDITQLSRDDEFDDADQILKEAGIQAFHVPGEHDMLDEGNGQAFLARYGKGSKGAGWFSFDHKGVHFVGLVNVADLRPGGGGMLGAEQIAWLASDLAGVASSTPVVVFAHIPLWMLYAEWGWGTDDAAQALAHLRRFGSVTILNGHIHQIAQKVEGQMIFHTARSTAFSAARARHRALARPADRARGAVARAARHHPCDLRPRHRADRAWSIQPSPDLFQGTPMIRALAALDARLSSPSPAPVPWRPRSPRSPHRACQNGRAGGAYLQLHLRAADADGEGRPDGDLDQ